MEHNENISTKSVANFLQGDCANNGHITVSHKFRELSTQQETGCKRSEIVCPSTPTVNGSSGHKMGSRRIFTPQFKLQVLESYRNDNDCKGNQRATARKYNIHRRQIQKWLQCESSLRSSVANITQNTVKHQFHNISIHQQVQKSSISGASVPLINVPYGVSNNHQHTHFGPETTRTDAANSTIIVPSLSSGVTTSTTQTQCVFSAANLAVVVAAAAGAAMTITSPPATNGTSISNESAPPSSLRPPSIIGASGSTATNISTLLHHHHHYGVPPYIHHTPATAQLPVPILAHHISHSPHMHQQPEQHEAYQYHNLTYTQSLTHQPSDKQQPQSLLSSMSLPDVNALSTAGSLAVNNGFPSALCEIEQKESADSKHLCSIAHVDNSVIGHCSEINTGSILSSHSPPEFSAINKPQTLYRIQENDCQMLYPLGPMDLSVRTRRDLNHKLPAITNFSENDSIIVDLTYRKRKILPSPCNVGMSEENQLKLKRPTEENKSQSNSNTDDDEVEIEVGIEEKLPPSKPVKLFKPYLLDTDSESSTTTPLITSDVKYVESSDNISWVRHTSSISPPPPIFDNSTGHCHSSTFQYSTVKENSIFSGEIKGENPKSAFTSIPTISPTSFRSPKRSPSSSGYESSSSTYSDSSFSSRGESYAYNRSYTLSLQMHSIQHEQLSLHRSKQVERWLEQESRNSLEPNSPIAILA